MPSSDGACVGGKGDAGAFEDVDHAKQTYRVIPGDQVVEETGHQLDGQGRMTVAYRLFVAATGLDVVEHPFFMAVFFFVINDCAIFIESLIDCRFPISCFQFFDDALGNAERDGVRQDFFP